jgi:PKD domain/RTX calcium-binding nonapeptide repeat (4 copies)
MRSCKSFLIPCVVLLGTGCGAGSNEPVSKVNQAVTAPGSVPRTADIAATLSPSSQVSVSMGGASATPGVTASSVALSLTSRNCNAATDRLGCIAKVEQFMVELASFTMDTSAGHFVVTNPLITLVDPTYVQDTGSGFVLPAGTMMAYSGTFEAEFANEHTIAPVETSVTAPLTTPVTFSLSPATQDLAINGSFPFQDENSNTLDGVSGTITISATAQKPFLNTPPVAHAGPDQVVSCGQAITLDASASTDLENNISSYTWVANGTVIATGAVAHVNLPPGSTSVQLNVQDTFGGFGVDVVNVTVGEAPPVFTFVPPPFVGQTCGAENIGQAQASSSCGVVTITNDAPATYPVGRRIVTWTATSPSGAKTQATQQVVVFPGDNRNCCPPGSHVIVGTSNNDVLTGTAGVDCILGLGGQDTINGLGGNDIISGGDGDDVIHGGDGDDLISGGTGQDQIFGENGNDILSGDDGDDHIDGAAGDDILFGGQGQDTLTCGTGNNQAFGGSGDDTLNGGIGNDLLDGGPDHNMCVGGGGSDQFISCTTVR